MYMGYSNEAFATCIAIPIVDIPCEANDNTHPARKHF